MSTSEPVEQRWSPRRCLRLGVTVVGRGQRAQQATCRDIGIGGIYVEFDPKLLTLDGALHVGFKLGVGEAQTHHRLAARVVHVGADGAGLMFSEFPLETLRALRAMVYDTEGVVPGARG